MEKKRNSKLLKKKANPGLSEFLGALKKKKGGTGVKLLKRKY